eukprot:TRINITY_DN14913_c0_g1_i1.p1 TRINITY_DN14913_c0_g1~~TRINITY_DN14913_c0_g1_i1.p1  ORF type:complete len:248 (+),score=66.64 TRINITY_DN14913_c0_g1_i1:73-744(+)
MTTVEVEYDEFENLMRTAEEAFNEFKEKAHTEEHQPAMQRVKQEVKAVMRQLKAAEMAIPEIRNGDERGVWRRKLANGRKAVRVLERELAQIDRLDSKKDKLFSSMKAHVEEGDDTEMTEQRAKLLTTSSMLHAQNKSLDRSEAVAIETERLGHNTINSLRGQRETMINIIDKTDTIREEISRSRMIINGIKRTMVYSRMMQFVIIAVLSIAITLVVYFKWLK